MRIIIDVEPSANTAAVTGPTAAPAETMTQAITEPKTQEQVLSAGASLAAGPEGRASALTAANQSVIAAGASAATPTPYSDSFSTASGPGMGVLGAGSAKC